jgi:hypothetical protein
MKMTVQIVAKRDRHAFEVLPRRWVVERTFAWISKHRRTVRDYEHLPASHEAMILWAMTALMTRRLTQPGDLSDAHLVRPPFVVAAGCRQPTLPPWPAGTGRAVRRGRHPGPAGLQPRGPGWEARLLTCAAPETYR